MNLVYQEAGPADVFDLSRLRTAAADRLSQQLWRPSAAESTATRALARFLLRGLDCGALDESSLEFDRSTLEKQ